MSYADYMIRLLRPLGVYDLSENTLNGCEIQTLGAAFDAVDGEIASNLDNSLVPTANRSGLDEFAKLLPLPLLTQNLEAYRTAICSLLALNGGCMSEKALRELLSQVAPGCSYEVVGTNRVKLHILAGPAMYQVARRAVAEFLLPCQVQVE